jgi:hypothetical protein
MRYDHYRVGKMISSPEEFEIAVKAPREDFGAPSRSASAPSEIEELLAKIREAEAAGQPSEPLHARLLRRIDEMRAQSTVRHQVRQPIPLPYQPKSMVITARRNQFGGERAQITTAGRAVKKSNSSVQVKKGKTTPANKATPDKRRAIQSRIAELMRQIRLAEAQGRPAQALRQELYEAVEAQK